MATTVDLGVATAPNQKPGWWNAMMARILEADRHDEINIGSIRTVSTAVTDHSKNQTVKYQDFADEKFYSKPAGEEYKGRNEKTDSNRVMIARGFLSGKADWLWFVDDDTVPPEDALFKLLKAQREIISGVYYLGTYPYNAIVYNRREDGLYQAFQNIPYGAVFQVDSIGMGCTLIHRSVFEKIVDEHVLMQRPTGSLVPIHKSDFRGDITGGDPNSPAERPYVENGILHTPLRMVDTETETRPYPFYAFEYGRTEDHHFCELLANVGIRPWVDSSIDCKHLKDYEVDRSTNKAATAKIEKAKGLNGHAD